MSHQPNIETLAEWSGLSIDDVRRACRGYDVEDYPKAVIFHLAKVFRQKGATRRDGLEIQNQLLQLKLEEKRGTSVPLEQAKRAWAQVIMLARGKFGRLGNILASRIAYLKDESAIEAEIQRTVDEALTELSRPVEYSPDAPDPAAS